MPSSLLKTLFLLALSLIVHSARAQHTYTFTGQTVDSKTGEALAFVNLGILGKPLGTVSDENGNFTLAFADSIDRDSIQVSMLGYESLRANYGEFRRRNSASGGRVGLAPAPIKLKEVTVRPGMTKEKVVGNSGKGSFIQAHFKINELGNQIGHRVYLRRESLIERVSFRVAQCTYDSMFFRVNLYQVVNGEVGTNLLPEPVYVRVGKGGSKDRLVADLSKYDILAKGDVLIALEMVKDLGPGMLTLGSRIGGGPIYYAKQTTNGWQTFPGFGVNIDAKVLEFQK